MNVARDVIGKMKLSIGSAFGTLLPEPKSLSISLMRQMAMGAKEVLLDRLTLTRQLLQNEF